MSRWPSVADGKLRATGDGHCGVELEIEGLDSSGRLSGSTSIKTVALVLPAGIVTWPCETPTKSLPATAVPFTVE